MKNKRAKRQSAKGGRWLPKIVCIILVFIFLAAGLRYRNYVSVQVEEACRLRDQYQSYADAEARWLLDGQLDNGALPYIPVANGEVWVNPYFSLNAALALAAYGSQQSLDAVKRYLQWHCAHMNTDIPDNQGLYHTIYDHALLVEDGKVIDEMSNQSYDSADSYAALLIKLLHSYTVKTDEHEVAVAYSDAFFGAVDVLEALMHNGLTYATVNYPVCYLMDNCEVYAGLCAAVELMETVYLPLDDTGTMSLQYIRIVKMRDDLTSALENTLWNPTQNRYEYAVQNETAFPFDQEKLYPDGISQLSPILWGVADAERAKMLYETFVIHHQWWVAGTDAAWGMSVYAAALVGDMELTARYFESFSNVILPERAYPYYNGEGACVLLAALTCVSYYENRMDTLDPLHMFHEA